MQTTPHTYKRWYDQDPELSQFMSAMSTMPHEQLHDLLNRVAEIINSHDPKYLKGVVFDPKYNKRWYDADSHVWLIISTLQIIPHEVMVDVKACLRQHLK